MPNHTSTILTLDGPLEDIEKFKENCNGKENLDFEKLHPMPPGNDDDWYNWRCKNWGTKWNAYDVGNWINYDTSSTLNGNSEKNNSIHYNTAWSPATPFYLHVSKSYPELSFTHEFADEGGGFVGRKTIKNGIITVDDNYDWDSQEGKELRTKLGYNYSEEEEDDNSEKEINKKELNKFIDKLTNSQQIEFLTFIKSLDADK